MFIRNIDICQTDKLWELHIASRPRGLGRTEGIRHLLTLQVKGGVAKLLPEWNYYTNLVIVHCKYVT